MTIEISHEIGLLTKHGGAASVDTLLKRFIMNVLADAPGNCSP